LQALCPHRAAASRAWPKPDTGTEVTTHTGSTNNVFVVITKCSAEAATVIWS